MAKMKVERIVGNVHGREISSAYKIGTFFHCGLCLKELPEGTSPRDWAQLEVGFTKIGLQVWCKRHDCNVVHIDFEGEKHPANTRRLP